MKLDLSNNKGVFGFKTKDPSALVFKDGKPFYFRENKNGTLFFNLPGGNVYDVKHGKLKECNPVIYPDLDIDEPNHYYPIRKLKIVIAPNKNRASISLEKQIAIISPSLAAMIDPVIVYVIGHEYSHNLYTGHGQQSELACDKLSCNTMLKIGYNPNQCIAGIRLALSNRPFALLRKDVILNQLNSIKDGIITSG